MPAGFFTGYRVCRPLQRGKILLAECDVSAPQFGADFIDTGQDADLKFLSDQRLLQHGRSARIWLCGFGQRETTNHQSAAAGLPIEKTATSAGGAAGG